MQIYLHKSFTDCNINSKNIPNIKITERYEILCPLNTSVCQVQTNNTTRDTRFPFNLLFGIFIAA